MVGVLTPQKLTSTANRDFLPPPPTPSQLNIYQHTTVHKHPVGEKTCNTDIWGSPNKTTQFLQACPTGKPICQQAPPIVIRRAGTQLFTATLSNRDAHPESPQTDIVGKKKRSLRQCREQKKTSKQNETKQKLLSGRQVTGILKQEQLQTIEKHSWK